MIKLYFLLCYEFTKIGVFALGGGYATLPFLYYIQTKYNWFSIDELTNMIAISNITPGAIGINMATYTGYKTAGIIGSILSTISIVLLPTIITILIIKLFNRYKSLNSVKSIFSGLRPASCALLASIGLKLLMQNIIYTNQALSFPIQIDYAALILFIVLMIPFSFMKKNPILAIVLGALGGIIFKTIM